MTDTTMTQDAVVIERTFNATPEFIWHMWTDAETFKKWYGPQGFTVPVAEMDVRVGGKRLICMASPDGSMKMWTTGEYTELNPYDRLVYTESPSDESGGLPCCENRRRHRQSIDPCPPQDAPTCRPPPC